MFKFLKKKKEKASNNELYVKTAALLIHAAKIDQKYEVEEKNIIKKTMISMGVVDEDANNIISEAEKCESNSNQILEFTREIKKADKNFKIKIIESLWHIIYSDGNADIYENSLMRRLSGLLYLEDKIVGEIKKKIKSG